MNETYEKILKREHFPIVYQWKDKPNTTYSKHMHKGRVTLYITEGSVHFYFENGTQKELYKGERFDVPPHIFHTAEVGKEGCSYVIGQETEDDA